MSRRLLFAFAALVLLVGGTLLSGCATEQPPAARVDPPKLALVIDRGVALRESLSARVAISDLLPLLQTIQQSGGALTLEVIDGSDALPVSITIEPPPAPPASTGNSMTDRRERKQYEENTLRPWQQRAEASVTAFSAAASQLLAQPRADAEPWQQIERAGKYLQQPSALTGARAYLILVSDRERVSQNCKDIYGNPTVPPESEIVDPSSGARYRCCADGVWHAVNLLPRDSNGTPSCKGIKPPPTGPGALPLDSSIQVVAVKGAARIGIVQDHPKLVEVQSLSDALSFIDREARRPK